MHVRSWSIRLIPLGSYIVEYRLGTATRSNFTVGPNARIAAGHSVSTYSLQRLSDRTSQLPANHDSLRAGSEARDYCGQVMSGALT